MKSKALSRIGALFAAILISAGAGAAHAQRVSLKSATLIEAPANTPIPEGHAFPYPTIEVKVGADPGLRQGDFVIKFADRDPPIAINATKVVPFKDSAEPMFMLILVQGTQRFMGATGDAEETKQGYYEPVKQAIEVFAKARTKNTQVAIWVYHASIDKKVDFSPADTVSPEAIGALTDFHDKATKGLNAGLQRASAELSNKAGRRVLVVIGDGEDQSDSWRPVRDNKTGLEGAAIEVYFLGAGPGVQDSRIQQNITTLGALGSQQIALQREQVKDYAEALANNLNNVYTVTFPGYQESDQQRMPFDGADHEFLVGVRKEETNPKLLTFPKIPLICGPKAALSSDCVCAKDRKPPDPKNGCDDGKKPWWLWVLIGVVALLVIVLVFAFVTRKKGDEIIEAPPEPIAAAPPPPVAPAGPAKTQALFIGDDNSSPVVGWIVPTSGPSAWQTFKLSSRSVIGTGPEAQINVGDSYMSANHCEILMNSNGFILMDRGSQNGVMVNSRRVTQHELVDNDVFTCGRTEFKFKSIT